MKRTIMAAVLAATLLSSCTASAADDLMQGITAVAQPQTELSALEAEAIAGFSVRLLENCSTEGASTLVSPLSVLQALGMTALGAQGNTRDELEAAFGMSADRLASVMHAWNSALAQTDTCALHLANSIWFTDDANFTVQPEFLQKNADWYGAGALRIPFDNTAVRTVNRWVSEHTDGQIPKMLEQISPDAVMLLVNALSFDAEWRDMYRPYQVRDASFTREDGTSVQVSMMYSEENVYLSDENASGFIRYYAGGDYAFAALLPDEGISVAEYVESLTGERLYAILSEPQRKTVETGLPSFETGSSFELSDALRSLGINDAFDSLCADFSDIGEAEDAVLVIGQILHKTTISVTERGTRAGAATVVEIDAATDCVPDDEPARVVLDRPFVYMLIDCETNLPFFIGTMMDPSK